MPDVHHRLAAWRQAERLRDTMPPESAGRDDAEQEVRHARLAYEATLARTAARYQGSADSSSPVWWPTLGSIRTNPHR